MVDPYDWLGVPKHQRPPTHYQLLGLTSSADQTAVEIAANRLLHRLEAHRTGPNAASAERLVTEIAEARDTLMDPERRQLYDILAPDPDDPAPPPPLPASAYIEDDPAPPPDEPPSKQAWWENAKPEESPLGGKAWWKAPPPLEPAAPPPPLPPVPPQPAGDAEEVPTRRRPIPVPLIAGGLAVVLLVAAGGAYFIRKSANTRSATTEIAVTEPERTPAPAPKPPPEPLPDVPVIGPPAPRPVPLPAPEPKPKEPPKKEDNGPRKLRGHLSAVVGVTPGRDRRVWSVGDDKALRLWIGTESTVMHTFGSPGIGVVSFDEGRRVAACDSFAVVLIDPTKPDEKKSLESARGGVRSLAVTADGKTVVTGLSDGFLRAWTVETAKHDEWQVLPRGDIHAIAVSADGRVLIAGADGAVALWQLAGQKKLFGWTPHKAGATSLSLSPDGTRAAIGGGDGMLVVHDLAGRKDVFRAPAHQGPVTAVVWDTDGKRLVTAGTDGIARLWDPQTGKPSRWTFPLDGRGTCAAYQTQGDRLLVGTVAGAVWDIPLPSAKGPEQPAEIKAPAEPLPVPPAEAVTAATAELRKEQGPPAEMAKGFLEAALGPDMPPAARFATFREARINAAKADDVPSVVAAARGIAAWFDVDEFKELAAGLGGMSGKVDPTAFGEALLEAAEKAELAYRPEMVARFLEIAAAVRGLPDDAARGLAAARTRAAGATAELTRVREATAVLKANPDDPEANATYGAYLCFGRRLWDRGLPYLARGPNAAIKAAAKADLAGTKSADGVLKVAESWLAVANGTDPRTRTAALVRAKLCADFVATGAQDAAHVGKAKAMLEAVAKLDATPGDPTVPFSLAPAAIRRGYDSVDVKVQKAEWATEGDTSAGVDGIRLGGGDPVARSLFDLLPGSRITFTIKPDGRDIRVVCAGKDVTLPATGKTLTLVLIYTGEELRFTTAADGGAPAERVAAVPPANRGPVPVVVRLTGEAKAPTGTVISTAIVRGPVLPAVPKPE